MTNNKIKCSCCKKEKQESDFYQNPNKANGRESQCKRCILDRKTEKYKIKAQRDKFRQSIADKKGSSLILVEQLKTEQKFVPRETEIQMSFFEILEEANL